MTWTPRKGSRQREEVTFFLFMHISSQIGLAYQRAISICVQSLSVWSSSCTSYICTAPGSVSHERGISFNSSQDRRNPSSATEDKKWTVENQLDTVNLQQSIFVTYAPVRKLVRCLSQGKTFACFCIFYLGICSDLPVCVRACVSLGLSKFTLNTAHHQLHLCWQEMKWSY